MRKHFKKIVALEDFYRGVEKRMTRGVDHDRNLRRCANVLWGTNYFLGLIAFGKNNMELTKTRFTNCSLIDIFLTTNYDSRFLDYGFIHIDAALLSDASFLKDRYANLSYKGDQVNYPDMEQMVLDGEGVIWCHTMQMLMKEDWDIVARNIEIIEKKVLVKDDPRKALDLEYFKAITDRDFDKIIAIINKMLEPNYHRWRNDRKTTGKIISHPAVGCAKMSWRLGLEIEIDSPLVPKELLPIEPIMDYKLEYEFLSNDGSGTSI